MTQPLQPDDPLTLGTYRLVARLGRGGMGTVFLGQDQSGTRVAIKVINPELAGDQKFHARFRREVNAARKVRRFCTAPVIDASLDEPPLYIVTEYIEGPTLEEAVEQGGSLRGSNLEGLAVGMAVALSAIHNAQIAHRDLKPANVLLSGVGPRVIDFGIARAFDAPSGITKTGQFIGTPAYMAPELFSGSRPTPASDVFSWGCVVAFAGTAQDPFSGTTIPEILHRVAHEPPWLNGLETELHEVVSHALSKAPEERPTVAALLDRLAGRTGNAPIDLPDLSVRSQSIPISSRPMPRPSPPRDEARPNQISHAEEPKRNLSKSAQPRPTRNPRLVIAIASALLLTFAIGYVLWPNESPSRTGGSKAGTSPSISQPTATTQSQQPPKNPGDIDPKFLSTWTGRITHHGRTTSTFSAVIKVTGGKFAESVGRSEYASEGCGGYLKLLSASKTRLVVEEHIDKGNGFGACKNVVVITLTYQPDGRLRYDYKTDQSRGTGILED